MNDTMLFERDYLELQTLDRHLQEMGFHTALHPVSEEVPVPMLVTALEGEDADHLLICTLAFTPYAQEAMPHLRLLQLSVEMNLEITESNRAALSEMMELVNGIIPAGHFAIIENALCYRYTLSLSEKEEITDLSVLEIFSFFSVMAIDQNDLFSKLASGHLSLEECKKAFLDDLA